MTLIISFFLWSLVSMFTPTNAKNTHTIMAARVLIGISQGFIIPSVHTVLSQVGSGSGRGYGLSQAWWDGMIIMGRWGSTFVAPQRVCTGLEGRGQATWGDLTSVQKGGWGRVRSVSLH